MKILHVIPSVSLVDGGPAVAIRGMTRALAARGHSVTVATTNASGSAQLDVPLGVPVFEDGVEYLYFERGAPRAWKFSWPLTRWLAKHARDYDVVHVHALFSYATIPASRYAHAAGVPYVLRPLGTLDPWSVGQGSWKKRPYLQLVERAHLRNAAAIHVTSEMEAESVRALGLGEKAAIIPLGVPAVAGTGDRRSGIGPLRLLFLSRLHPKKGIPLLLEALARLATASASGDPCVNLTIAGDGAPEYRAELSRLVGEQKLGEHVRFVGQVSGAAKEQILRESDAFVLPSSQENFGIAVAEAMAAGLPVIVSDQVAIAREAAEAGAGIEIPLDTERLAAAIAQLRDDATRRVQMGNAARELASARYSWQTTAERLEALYADIARRAEPRRNSMRRQQKRGVVAAL